MVCEDPYTSDLEKRMVWKQNDTITEHYERVEKALKDLSKDSIQKKKKTCIKFLTASIPEAWFPGGDKCIFP